MHKKNNYDEVMNLKRKQLSLALAALGCCVLLFAVGLTFGMKDRGNSGPLIDKRIRVIPPIDGHASVRPETVAMARDVLEHLPPKVYRLLQDNGASVNLAPNIEDNWPGSGDGLKPSDPDSTMGEEGAHYYGRDIWLYEAEKIRGSKNLKPARDIADIRQAMYQIMGHCVNDTMGGLTKNPQLRKFYNEDLGELPDEVKANYRLPHETEDQALDMTCSEIIGVLLGGEPYSHQVNILKNFPRTSAYYKKRLELN